MTATSLIVTGWIGSSKGTPLSTGVLENGENTMRISCDARLCSVDFYTNAVSMALLSVTNKSSKGAVRDHSTQKQCSSESSTPSIYACCPVTHWDLTQRTRHAILSWCIFSAPLTALVFPIFITPYNSNPKRSSLSINFINICCPLCMGWTRSRTWMNCSCIHFFFRTVPSTKRVWAAFRMLDCYFYRLHDSPLRHVTPRWHITCINRSSTW